MSARRLKPLGFGRKGSLRSLGSARAVIALPQTERSQNTITGEQTQPAQTGFVIAA